MITQCPHCRQQYEVDNQFDGEIVQCQECHQEFVIEKFENNIVLRKIQKTHLPEKKTQWYQKVFIGCGVFLFFLGVLALCGVFINNYMSIKECGLSYISKDGCVMSAVFMCFGLFIAVAPFCKSR